MSGTIEITHKAGKYRWRLKDRAGNEIAFGGPYNTRAAVRKGVDSFRGNTADASIVDIG